MKQVNRRFNGKRGGPLGLTTAALAASGVLLAAACSVNPATGQRQLSLVSESQEISMGAQNDTAIIAEMGLVPDQGLQQYIRGMGAKLSSISERPQLNWTYRVVEDPVAQAVQSRPHLLQPLGNPVDDVLQQRREHIAGPA